MRVALTVTSSFTSGTSAGSAPAGGVVGGPRCGLDGGVCASSSAAKNPGSNGIRPIVRDRGASAARDRRRIRPGYSVFRKRSSAARSSSPSRS